MVFDYVFPSLRVCNSRRRVSFYAILIRFTELCKSEIGLLIFDASCFLSFCRFNPHQHASRFLF